MFEVELKFRVPNPDEALAGLVRLNAEKSPAIEQIDQYFAHPVRSFADTDEALRIRRVGERNFVTYKGPKIDATTKTRREIEVPLRGGAAVAEAFGELLIALSFQPVATVRKLRTAYHLTWQSRQLEIAIDEVDGLGTFIEIESAAPEAELEAARAAVMSLAEELGLTKSERRSYLEILLEAGQAQT